MLRFYNSYALAKKWVIAATIASPQSRDFKRYGEMGMETQALLKRITIDPEICHGKPCIRGLRYPVEVILELLSAGMSSEEILADYEDLEYEDILASLAFATRLSQVKRLETVLA